MRNSPKILVREAKAQLLPELSTNSAFPMLPSNRGFTTEIMQIPLPLWHHSRCWAGGEARLAHWFRQCGRDSRKASAPGSTRTLCYSSHVSVTQENKPSSMNFQSFPPIRRIDHAGSSQPASDLASQHSGSTLQVALDVQELSFSPPFVHLFVLHFISFFIVCRSTVAGCDVVRSRQTLGQIL